MRNDEARSKAAGGQTWNADGYQTHTGFVSTLGTPVVDLLAPMAGEAILDLGCGDGVLTEKLAAAGVEVTGVDSSAEMIEAARNRGLNVRCLDAGRLDYDADYDAVFSNAALHWMLDPDAVIAGVARALKPGGRFVGEFGGHGNVAAITVALVAVLGEHGVDGTSAIPWYFPTTAAYRAKLEDHGFTVTSIDLIPRPTPLPTDMAGWLNTMAGPFFAALDQSNRESALNRILQLLQPCLYDEMDGWTADYVRLRFAAKRTS